MGAWRQKITSSSNINQSFRMKRDWSAFIITHMLIGVSKNLFHNQHSRREVIVIDKDVKRSGLY
jgi:hypothetical protein